MYITWTIWLNKFKTMTSGIRLLKLETIRQININQTMSTGCSKKTDPLVYFDDNFCKYGPILTIFSLLEQEIHDAHKLSYFSHLTFIMLPLYLAKQTPMLVSMWIFMDHARKQISMYSNGWNIYLFIYSNDLWCHYNVIIVFARLPFDCPLVVGFLKQTSNTCLRPSLSRKLCY